MTSTKPSTSYHSEDEQKQNVPDDEDRDDMANSPGQMPYDDPMDLECSGPGSGSEADSLPTEDEIAEAQEQFKSKKTMKRKRRATSPTRFGATLQALINTSTPANLPLPLKPSSARLGRYGVQEKRERKQREGEKKDKEEKNHINDVIGGWGVENERALRKVAQRGVVKLFNAIQQSQAAAAATQEETKATRGSGRPTLPAPALSKSKQRKSDASPHPRGNSSFNLNQDAFLQMIKSGGMVA